MQRLELKKIKNLQIISKLFETSDMCHILIISRKSFIFGREWAYNTNKSDKAYKSFQRVFVKKNANNSFKNV